MHSNSLIVTRTVSARLLHRAAPIHKASSVNFLAEYIGGVCSISPRTQPSPLLFLLRESLCLCVAVVEICCASAVTSPFRSVSNRITAFVFLFRAAEEIAPARALPTRITRTPVANDRAFPLTERARR